MVSVEAIQTEKYDLSREAFRGALLADSWQHLRIYRRLFGGAAALVVAGAIALGISTESSGFVLDLVQLWLPILVFVGLWPIALALFSAFYVTRVRAQQAEYGLQSCTISDALITINPEAGTPIEIPLDRIVRCGQSGDHIVLYYGRWSGEVIPTQAVAPADRTELSRRLTRVCR